VYPGPVVGACAPRRVKNVEHGRRTKECPEPKSALDLVKVYLSFRNMRMRLNDAVLNVEKIDTARFGSIINIIRDSKYVGTTDPSRQAFKEIVRCVYK
jgi:hypothetical protein